MKKQIARLGTLALLFAVAMPVYAGAQTPAEIEAAKRKAAPAARPAPPAARPAPPAARPAPPPAVARPAPPPAARIAPPRPQPPAARIAPPSQTPAARIFPQRPDRQRAVERPRPPGPAINRAERNAPARAATPSAAPNVGQRAVTPAAPVSRAQVRQQQRQERLLQRREDRALRNLPPQQRAARREQIQQQRQQRAAARQGIAPNAAIAPAARAGSLASVNRGPRRNGQARITPQAARQGRFAGPLLAQAVGNDRARLGTHQVRAGRYAPRRAWQRGLRAAFVPWYGPVFWPYAYSDIFDYTFWPGGYDTYYWDYAYDDFFDGVFYGEVGPPAEYVGSVGDAPRAAQPSYTAVRNLCAQPGNGITAWPIAEIEKKVGLNHEQIALLGDVRTAGSKAADVFKATCPSENAFPLTPPGRLASMTARLEATLAAVQTVRPPLEKFYDQLSDEQKERFNALGPSKAAASAEAREALPDDAKKCGEAKPGLTNLPIEQIEDVIAPNETQQAELDKLGEATVKAVGILQGACPAQSPLTPPGRLQAIETRLSAMIEASRTVKPALDSFYASLNAEQKARFNRLGRELAQTSAQADQ